MARDPPGVRRGVTKRLVLITGRDAEAPAAWASGDVGALEQAGTLPSATDGLDTLPAAEEVVVVLPGEQAAPRRLRLPVKGDRQLAAAAMLAFEDVLAEPAADFHFGWTPADADGFRLVCAVPRRWLKAWLSVLSPIEPAVVTIDHAALASPGAEGVLLHAGGRMVARLPAGGMTAEEDVAAPLIDAMAPGAALLSVRVGASGAAIGGDTLVLADNRALGAFYLSALSEAKPPNLRRGAFAPRRHYGGSLKRGRVAGGLLAAVIAIWLGGDLAQGIKAQRAAAALRAEAAEDFSAAFPDTRIVDLERQAERRAVSGGRSLFLPLSAVLLAALENNEGVDLSGLTYDDGGRLVADVRYRDFGALESLTRTIEARGIIAREGANPRRDETGAFVDRLTLEVP
jgi:type II secretion system protein L